MIVTRAPDESVPTAQIEADYVGRTVDVYQWGHRFTVYVHEDRVGDVPGWETAGDELAR